jgi:hypothetical protein
VGLTIAVIVVEKEADTPPASGPESGFVDALKKWGRKKKHRRKHGRYQGPLFTEDEWYQISLGLVFVSPMSSLHDLFPLMAHSSIPPSSLL